MLLVKEYTQLKIQPVQRLGMTNGPWLDPWLRDSETIKVTEGRE